MLSTIVISEDEELRAVMRTLTSDVSWSAKRLYDSVCHILSSSPADACQSKAVLHSVPLYNSTRRYSPESRYEETNLSITSRPD